MAPTGEMQAGVPVGPEVVVSVVSGPDCRLQSSHRARRLVIGRSSDAHIRIADERVGLHHVVLDVNGAMDEVMNEVMAGVTDSDEVTVSVTVTQLSGRTPIRIDDEPFSGTRTVEVPTRLSIGTSELLLDTARSNTAPLSTGSVVGAPLDPWRRIVHRGPDRPIGPVADPIEAPTPADAQRNAPATALIGAAVGVLGAGALALLLGQMLFALFAALGAAASAATWLAGVATTWRRNRRAHRFAEVDRQRFIADLRAAQLVARQHHEMANPDLSSTLGAADALVGPPPVRSDVWQRRLTGSQPDACESGSGGPVFRPVIGTGTCRWSPVLAGDLTDDVVAEVDRAATIEAVPIPAALAWGEVTAISGGSADRAALLRAIVCQMAVRHGPADWQLVVVAATPQTWAWAGWFPHAFTAIGSILIADATEPDEVAAVLALAGGSTSRSTLLVVDNPALLSARTGALRRFIERVRPATLTTVDAGAPPPALCNVLIEVGSTGAVMITRLDGGVDDIADTATAIRLCGLSLGRAATIARSLAGTIDPEMFALGRPDLPGWSR